MQIAQVFPDFKKFTANFPKEWEIKAIQSDYEEQAIITLLVKKGNTFIKVMLVTSNDTIIPHWIVSSRKKTKPVSEKVDIFEKELLIKAIEKMLVQ